MADLLLEIGVEEVPARMLAAAQRELGERLRLLLANERLADAANTEINTYSTPRRLAVYAHSVQEKQHDAVETLLGPAWSRAFQDGVPAPAAHAFAKKAGVMVADLKKVDMAKGAYVTAEIARPGRSAVDVLARLLPKEIAALNWPKPMYWRAGKPERFVRPVHWLVALLGEQVVPFEFAGRRAGNQSRGHRVLHGPAPLVIAVPSSYTAILEAAHVLPDVEARRHRIRKALDHATRTVPGARWREDEPLVDTVTHLTEWPSVVIGSFAPDYLALPEEVLVTVMRDHQKYFAVEDAQGKLLPHFLTVLNTVTDVQGESVIRHGNERVLRARFSDAQFFWNFDNKTPLAERIALLDKVTFQKDLGTYRQKTDRTVAIADALARCVADRGVVVDRNVLTQAATLAKADLTTELVKEFTELQGIVGGLYARRAGLPEAVSSAIYWQYRPASMTDAIAPTVEAQLLGIADRIGTVVDLFQLGLVPSGSKDPYALRRAANGVIKILAASRLPLTLQDVVSSTFLSHEDKTAQAKEVRPFLRERLEFYLREVAALDSDVVAAVLAASADDVPDTQARGEALREVRGSDDLAAIAAAWKRTKNILRQAGEKSLLQLAPVDETLLHEEAEQQLWRAFKNLLPDVARLRDIRSYQAALELTATLRPYVDRFFDSTMVLVENPALRGNRLALLSSIVTELGRIADFSELATPAQESAK